MIPHDLDSGVLLVGRMENPSRWYSAADVMYHSSLEDTFPTVVLEAVESGLPVIAHEGAGGAAEIISQIGIGTVLKGNSNLDTIAAIATVQMDSGSRIVNAQRGKRLIAERFSESGYAAGIREIVEGAIGKGCGSWASHD
jgi:glycosyltransferase involved in cell wall biosynthesis